MTSKEALEKLCKVKIYQKEASAYDYLGKEVYKQEIDTIKQDLERLEVLTKSSKDFQDRVFNIINTYKKAIEILKRKTVNLDILKLCDNVKDYNDFQLSMLSQQEYELLKEVISNE